MWWAVLPQANDYIERRDGLHGRRRNKHLGSSFDEFLQTEGLYEEVTALAWKRVLSWEVAEAMKKGGYQQE